MSDSNSAPHYDTVRSITTVELESFRATLIAAEKEGCNFYNLKYLTDMHAVKGAYYSAAGLFAIAGAIQALHQTIVAEIAEAKQQAD